MRDKIKTPEYFESFLNNNRIFIDRLEHSPVKNSPVIQKGLTNGYWQRCLAMYSAGYEIGAVVQEYEKSMRCFYNADKKMVGLSELVEYLSFAKIIDNAETIEKINYFCKKNDFSDAFLSYISGICSIKECVLSKIESIRHFAKNNLYSDGNSTLLFLDKTWYDLHDEDGWYDSHLSKNPVYYGYWAFEIAAILKNEGHCYSELRACQFFPSDLFDEFHY